MEHVSLPHIFGGLFLPIELFQKTLVILLLTNSGYCASSCSCDCDSGSKLGSSCFYKRFYTREMQACAKPSSERSGLVLTTCVCVCAHLCPTLLCSQPGSAVHGSQFPFPMSGDLPYPGIEPVSLASSALVGQFFTTVPPGKPSF